MKLLYFLLFHSVHCNAITTNFHVREAVTEVVFLKKIFLKISQNSQENTFVRVQVWNRQLN